MNVHCDEIEPLLSDFIDGQVDKEQSAMIRAHVETCSRCREIYQDLKHLTEQLASLPDTTPPKRLRRVTQHQAVDEGLLRRHRRRIPTASTAAWIVAAAAAFLVAVLVYPWITSSQPDPPIPETMTGIFQDLDHAEALYIKAIDRMERLARTQLSQMPEDIRQTFEKNLVIIDGTLAESRTFLLENRQKPRAWEYMLAAYQKKVDFLTLIIETDFG